MLLPSSFILLSTPSASCPFPLVITMLLSVSMIKQKQIIQKHTCKKPKKPPFFKGVILYFVILYLELPELSL